jgi:hypothetical protein
LMFVIDHETPQIIVIHALFSQVFIRQVIITNPTGLSTA